MSETFQERNCNNCPLLLQMSPEQRQKVIARLATLKIKCRGPEVVKSQTEHLLKPGISVTEQSKVRVCQAVTKLGGVLMERGVQGHDSQEVLSHMILANTIDPAFELGVVIDHIAGAKKQYGESAAYFIKAELRSLRTPAEHLHVTVDPFSEAYVEALN